MAVLDPAVKMLSDSVGRYAYDDKAGHDRRMLADVETDASLDIAALNLRSHSAIDARCALLPPLSGSPDAHDLARAWLRERDGESGRFRGRARPIDEVERQVKRRNALVSRMLGSLSHELRRDAGASLPADASSFALLYAGFRELTNEEDKARALLHLAAAPKISGDLLRFTQLCHEMSRAKPRFRARIGEALLQNLPSAHRSLAASRVFEALLVSHPAADEDMRIAPLAGGRPRAFSDSEKMVLFLRLVARARTIHDPIERGVYLSNIADYVPRAAVSSGAQAILEELRVDAELPADQSISERARKATLKHLGNVIARHDPALVLPLLREAAKSVKDRYARMFLISDLNAMTRGHLWLPDRRTA